MKLRVGDQVLVTAGKDKGKQGKITRVLPKLDAVVVEGMNLYVKHIKPYGERAGERVRRERPLPTAKVAILNEKGQPDRVGYRVTAAGKERIFKKTGTVIGEAAKQVKAAAKKVEKTDKKTDKPAKEAKVTKSKTKKA